MDNELVEIARQQPLALVNWDEFKADIDEIKMLFDKVVEKYQLKEDSIDTIWYKGKFSICINLPKLRGDC